jgi:hypothetical protein
MSCCNSNLPQVNNDCCTDVAEYTRFAYSSAQSAYANAQNAEQSANDAAALLVNVVLKTGDTMSGLLILSGDPAVALGAATKQYVDTADALKVNKSGDTITGPVVLDVNSPATALRVTQQGAGISFLVEDSTNPDTTPFQIDATGTVCIGTQAAIEKLTVTGGIQATGSIRTSGSLLGVGYSTGAGGTETQLTSKATTVILNNTCGQITLNNATLNANTTVSFTLTNSAIEAGDVLVLNHISGGSIGSYLLNAQSAAGSATINVRNITSGNLSEAIVIAFAVIKAVTT